MVLRYVFSLGVMGIGNVLMLLNLGVLVFCMIFVLWLVKLKKWYIVYGLGWIFVKWLEYKLMLLFKYLFLWDYMYKCLFFGVIFLVVISFVFW